MDPKIAAGVEAMMGVQNAKSQSAKKAKNVEEAQAAATQMLAELHTTPAKGSIRDIVNKSIGAISNKR